MRTDAKMSPEEVRFAKFCASWRQWSHAQLAQDMWVLFETDLRRRGYFVDIGASDGIKFSNTFMLERQFEWSGLLAEPNPAHVEVLKAVRKAPNCAKCVYSRSGATVDFLLAPAPELSTIASFADKDFNAAGRNGGTLQKVETISLNDLLAAYNAPRAIDFLSLDTEGSELEILSAFDFSKYEIELIAVEHNFTSNEAEIEKLLAAQGYLRRFRATSRWDAWFTKRG